MHYFRLSGLVDLRMYENILEYYSNPENNASSDISGKNYFQLTQSRSLVNAVNAFLCGRRNFILVVVDCIGVIST